MATGSSVVFSAPGKVILFGEQVVVLGCTAIATALDLRTFVRIDVNGTDIVHLNLPDLNINTSWPVASLQYTGGLPEEPSLQDDLVQFLETLCSGDRGQLAFLFLLISISRNTVSKGISVHVKSEFQPGVGMGSSAAYNVALAGALLEHFEQLAGSASPTNYDDAAARDWQRVWSPNQRRSELINKWAFQAEKIMHGTPSGVDNAICTYGGAVSLKQGVITPIQKIPKVQLVVTNTRVSRNTRALVTAVGARCKAFPDICNPLLASSESLAQAVLKLFIEYKDEEDEAKLKQLESTLETFIDVKQGILVALGVGHPALDMIINTGKEFGFHSKLTGAGGGGCGFTLIPRRADATSFRIKLEDSGFQCFDASTGAPGVLMHTPEQAKM